MSLQLLGQTNVIEIVEAINRVTKSLIVFFFDEEIIISIVNGFNVELQVGRINYTTSSYSRTTYMLDSDEVGANEWDVIDLAERAVKDGSP